jgi:hypothetical protein
MPPLTILLLLKPFVILIIPVAINLRNAPPLQPPPLLLLLPSTLPA